MEDLVILSYHNNKLFLAVECFSQNSRKLLRLITRMGLKIKVYIL